MIETISNKDYRDYQWYEHGYHISERIVKANEYLLNQIEFGQLTVEDLKEFENDRNLCDSYMTKLGYTNTYELKDIYDRIWILIEYLNRGNNNE